MGLFDAVSKRVFLGGCDRGDGGLGVGGGEFGFLGLLLLQLVDYGHELIDFGDDAALFFERGYWNWESFGAP